MKRKPKINQKSYPRFIPDRFKIGYGRFGAYFIDMQNRDHPMDLEQVLCKLESQNIRTQQLRWYVETFGEVRYVNRHTEEAEEFLKTKQP